jgi:dGTPase
MPTKGHRRFDENGRFKIKNPYLEDFIRITSSHSYRRLAYKTQAISLPDSPHISTRLVHTNEVINISMIIAEMLGLNRELCMAIAAGHDIGHVPYGHLGERALSELAKKELGKEYEFKHNIYSVVMAQHIEKKLNLTHETLEGMLYHSRGSGKLTANKAALKEYNAVMYADKIAYVLSDFDDALRTEYLAEKDTPAFVKKLGSNIYERKDKVIEALVEESMKKNLVEFEDCETAKNFNRMFKYLYDEIYPQCNRKSQTDSIFRICEFFAERKEFINVNPIIAYSLLTDNEAYELSSLFLKPRHIPRSRIEHFGVFEYLPLLRAEKIDYTDPDLDW